MDSEATKPKISDDAQNDWDASSRETELMDHVQSQVDK